MTIRQKMTELLEDHGIWPQDAPVVLERYLASPSGEPMRGRMNDDASAYPLPVQSAVWTAVKREALAFVDETCPKAWYRPMLE